MALWAFCPIALNLVTYIRMYLLLVTLALAFLDALFDMFNASFANRSVYFRLFVISLLGFLTHFYFYIYLFFVSCFFTIYFWARKGWRFSFKYGVTIVLSVCLSFIIFPPALSNMFGNHDVESASSQSGVMVLLRRIWQFLGSSSVDLFFGSRLLLIACFCLSIALCFYLLWNKKINREHPELIYIVLLFNSSLVFYVTACYVPPFTSSRYICLAYPGLLLFGFGMSCIYLDICKFAIEIVLISIFGALFWFLLYLFAQLLLQILFSFLPMLCIYIRNLLTMKPQ